MHRIFHADNNARKAAAPDRVDFSAVSGLQATQLLHNLQFTEIDGFEEAPFETPAGQNLNPNRRSLLQHSILFLNSSDMAYVDITHILFL